MPTQPTMSEPIRNRVHRNQSRSSWLMLTVLVFAGSHLLAMTLPVKEPTLPAQDSLLLHAAQPDAGSPPIPPSPAAPPTADVPEAEGVGEVTAETEFNSVDASPQAAASQAAASQAETVRTLSVEPQTRPLLPANSPAWITAAPDCSAAIHRIPVGSLPTTRADETEGGLDEPLLAALYDYVDTQVVQQPGASEKLHSQLSVNYIRRNLIEDPAGFTAELTTSNGPMYQKWVMLSVTAEQREQLKTWHREALQRERLAPLGLGVVAAIGFIGLSHMVLRRLYGLPKSKPLSSQNYVALPIHAQPAGQLKKKKCCGIWGSGAPIVLGLFIAFILLGTIYRVMERGREHGWSADPDIEMLEFSSADSSVLVIEIP